MNNIEMSAGAKAEQGGADDNTTSSHSSANITVVRSFLSPTEIKIGNWIKGVYGNCIIHSIAVLGGEFVLSYFNSPFSSKHDGLVNLNDCRPIMLSPQIMECCQSFRKEDVYNETWFVSNTENIEIEVAFYDDINEMQKNYYDELKPVRCYVVNKKNTVISVEFQIEFLHELQNLFFLVARQEMEVVIK
jgi:hypothetical protein